MRTRAGGSKCSGSGEPSDQFTVWTSTQLIHTESCNFLRYPQDNGTGLNVRHALRNSVSTGFGFYLGPEEPFLSGHPVPCFTEIKWETYPFPG